MMSPATVAAGVAAASAAAVLPAAGILRGLWAAEVRGAERMRRAVAASKQVEAAGMLRFFGISVEPSASASGESPLAIIAALRGGWTSAPVLLRTGVNATRSAAISLLGAAIEAGAIALPRVRLRCV